jgi:hypothetical protein
MRPGSDAHLRYGCRGFVKTWRADFSLKGCQIVAGGRSVAQTTGKERLWLAPWRGATVFLTPFQGVELFSICSPVVCATLRPPATI